MTEAEAAWELSPFLGGAGMVKSETGVSATNPLPHLLGFGAISSLALSSRVFWCLTPRLCALSFSYLALEPPDKRHAALFIGRFVFRAGSVALVLELLGAGVLGTDSGFAG